MLIRLAAGEVRAVYSDTWRPLLEALGSLEITRASDVEYDASTGEWYAVHRATGKEIARGRNREQVIREEVRWLETNSL